jgi:uncharacterized protein
VRKFVIPAVWFLIVYSSFTLTSGSKVVSMDFIGKKKRLIENIKKRGSMLIAFSGGVDSSLLAALAKETLGDRSRCILLDSPVVSRAAVREAEQVAGTLALTLEIIPVPLMDDRQFIKNPSDRCYFCKKNSAIILQKRARDLGLACIADGINISDLGEHRPGLAAGTEEGIVHPFIEEGITKEDIREIARQCGYSFWDKPSDACLSSRIPYGEVITTEKLAMIEQAEAILAKWGFLQSRVRVHGTVARIEVIKEEFSKIFTIKDEIVKEFRIIGFSYVSLDLEGYRSGSMDEVL